ncbi:MAG: hypothetical protein RBU37_24780 [Myxococcota bacterium]|jgi:hypothetical protein|nr:hypothetical protein [Myxococcota bacterium]
MTAPSSAPNVFVRLAQSKLFRLLALLAILPFLALSLLVVGGAFFASVFVDRVAISNQSEQVLMLTPVGRIDTKRMPLPVLYSRTPALPAQQRGAFELAPGASLELLYDSDSAQLSELVFIDARGQSGMVRLEPGTQSFTLQSFDELEELSEPVLLAAIDAQEELGLPWLLIGIIVAPWAALFGWLWLRRRSHRTT